MLQYTIRSSNPLTHYLQIEALFNIPDHKGPLDLVIPFWRPGRYEGAAYAKNIRDFSIEDENGNVLPLIKTTTNSWRISSVQKSIVIKYSYFAFQADAGASYVDDDFWLLNPVNFLVYPEKNEQLPCKMHVHFPAGWEVATTLENSGSMFTASNYYDLTDRPLLASHKITTLKYEVDKKPFKICYYGNSPIDFEELLPAFRAFSQSQAEMFGSCPFSQYYFLIVIFPFRFYHGVEHADNTVLVLGIDEGTDSQKFIDDLFGVASHELFHAWNIKKIRPRELLTYNLKSPVIFNSGVIAEGFTTYYGDLFLARSGVWTIDRYLEELNAFLKRHFRNQGRYYASLSTSSENLWLDGYKNGAPYHKVSIYIKGAIVSLMLDLKIRKHSDHKHSLDDVLTWMDGEKSVSGYTLEEIREKAEQLSGTPLVDFFDKYIYGFVNVEEELKNISSEFGLELLKIEPENGLERHFGLLTSFKEDYLIVEMLDRGSPAESVLSLNDQILLINNKKPIEFTNDKIEAAKEVELTVKRLGRLITVNMKKTGDAFLVYHQLVKKPTLSSLQETALNRWIFDKK